MTFGNLWWFHPLDIFRPLPLLELFKYIGSLGQERVDSKKAGELVQRPRLDPGLWKTSTAEKNIFLTKLPDGVALLRLKRCDCTGDLPEEDLLDCFEGPIQPDFVSYWNVFLANTDPSHESRLVQVQFLKEVNRLYEQQKRDDITHLTLTKLGDQKEDGPLRAIILSWLIASSPPSHETIGFVSLLLQTLCLNELDTFVEATALVSIGIALSKYHDEEKLNNANHLLSLGATMHRKCGMPHPSIMNCLSAVRCRALVAKHAQQVHDAIEGLENLQCYVPRIPSPAIEPVQLEIDMLKLVYKERAGQTVSAATVAPRWHCFRARQSFRAQRIETRCLNVSASDSSVCSELFNNPDAAIALQTSSLPSWLAGWNKSLRVATHRFEESWRHNTYLSF